MELISRIINDEELSPEDKTLLIEKVFKASHGMDRFVTPGFYLHTDKNDKQGKSIFNCGSEILMNLARQCMDQLIIIVI